MRKGEPRIGEQVPTVTKKIPKLFMLVKVLFEELQIRKKKKTNLSLSTRVRALALNLFFQRRFNMLVCQKYRTRRGCLVGHNSCK